MKAANPEMVEGYMDGLNLNCPEPSGNRSYSYRHGFECGRDDRLNRHRFLYQTLAKMAADAMEKDAVK